MEPVSRALRLLLSKLFANRVDVLPDTNASWARKLISKYIAGEAGRLRAELEAE